MGSHYGALYISPCYHVSNLHVPGSINAVIRAIILYRKAALARAVSPGATSFDDLTSSAAVMDVVVVTRSSGLLGSSYPMEYELEMQ